MRRFLDALYKATAAMAGVFMIALLIAVLLSILGRQLHFNIPGIDAYAGYMMAGAGFLALAHTLKRGEHLRVTLLIQALHGQSRKALELFALSAASGLAGLAAWYSARLVWQSYAFHDVSTSSDGTPLWIPQLAMAVGMLVLFIAFVDELWLEWTGQRVQHESSEALHNE